MLKQRLRWQICYLKRHFAIKNAIFNRLRSTLVDFRKGLRLPPIQCVFCSCRFYPMTWLFNQPFKNMNCSVSNDLKPISIMICSNSQYKQNPSKPFQNLYCYCPSPGNAVFKGHFTQRAMRSAMR